MLWRLDKARQKYTGMDDVAVTNVVKASQFDGVCQMIVFSYLQTQNLVESLWGFECLYLFI